MNSSVLIAHGHGDLGGRIADACSERGIQCRVVPHGAAALETALAEVPEVLVVERDLPLIDGEKLGAILRTNPRTQSVQLLFLGDRDGEAETRSDNVQVLSLSAPPEDVAESVRTLLDEREKAQRTDREADEEKGGGVEGVLAQLPLADLLQLFHVSRKTGVVELERRDGGGHRENGRVLVSRGDTCTRRL